MLGYCFEKSVSVSLSNRSSSGEDDQPIRRRLPDGTAPAAGLLAAAAACVGAPAAGAVVAAGAEVVVLGWDWVGPHAATSWATQIRMASQRIERIAIPPSPQAALPGPACVPEPN